MHRILRLILLLATLAAVRPVFAQQDLTGPWQGKLAVNATTTMTIRFTLSKHPDGTYAAVLDSPDNPGIKNVPVTAVSFAGGTLRMTVASLSGSYAGTLKDGKFAGKWTQPGSSLPLVLGTYQKPVMTKAAIDTLVGAWNGPILIPGVKATFLVRFKVNDKGEITGALSVPEEPERGENPLQDIAFTDNALEFKAPAPAGAFTFHGTYANGVFTGTWLQAGAAPPGLALTLKKGDVASKVYPLKLSGPAFASLAGKWSGKLSGPRQTITLIMRFEVYTNGQYVGYIDIPDQAVRGIPVAEADIVGSQFTFRTNAPPGQFAGTISGKSIAGQWTQGAGSIPLDLTRE